MIKAQGSSTRRSGRPDLGRPPRPLTSRAACPHRHRGAAHRGHRRSRHPWPPAVRAGRSFWQFRAFIAGEAANESTGAARRVTTAFMCANANGRRRTHLALDRPFPLDGLFLVARLCSQAGACAGSGPRVVRHPGPRRRAGRPYGTHPSDRLAFDRGQAGRGHRRRPDAHRPASLGSAPAVDRGRADRRLPLPPLRSARPSSGSPRVARAAMWC